MMLVDPRRYRANDPQNMLVWTGTAVGCTKLSDVRITGQMLMLRLLKDFPRSSSAGHGPGWVGVAIAILTPDGNTLWPTVVNVAKGSPADKSGLRMWDIIWAVDGRSTANLSLSQVLGLLGGDPGDTKKLTIARLKETSDIPVRLSAYGQPAG
jgi:S1-C subfamily serine protease